MKSPLTLLAALCLLVPAAHAEKLEQWLKILPKNTLGYIAIKSAPELMADWEKSGYGKMMADEEFKKWTAPMYKDGEAVWDKELKESTGEGLEANLKRIQGSVLMAFAADSPKDFEKTDNNSPFLILMETGDQQAKVGELLAKEVDEDIAEDNTLKKITKDVAGVPLQVLAVSEEAEAKWKQAYAFVDDVLVIGDKPALLEYFIAALKTGTAEASDIVPSHLTRHAQLTDGTADISIYTNGEVLMQWLQDGLSETMKNGKSQMPMDPKMIFEALGTKEFQSFGVGIDLSDSQSRVDVTLLHPAKPTGFLSLFRGSSTEVSLPAFIPADALAGQVSRQSLGDIWDGLLGMVNKLGPLAMMATMQVGQIEQQMGIVPKRPARLAGIHLGSPGFKTLAHAVCHRRASRGSNRVFRPNRCSNHKGRRLCRTRPTSSFQSEPLCPPGVARTSRDAVISPRHAAPAACHDHRASRHRELWHRWRRAVWAPVPAR
jgi:hypothetical protein